MQTLKISAEPVIPADGRADGGQVGPEPTAALDGAHAQPGVQPKAAEPGALYLGVGVGWYFSVLISKCSSIFSVATTFRGGCGTGARRGAGRDVG